VCFIGVLNAFEKNTIKIQLKNKAFGRISSVFAHRENDQVSPVNSDRAEEQQPD
jgi:hypothetical protein